MKDKFISFKKTDHEHPYTDPEVVKIEDIFGFMMCYRKPYSDDSRKSLKNYRNRLTKNCKKCRRFVKQECSKYEPRNVWVPTSRHLQRMVVHNIKMDTCRVMFLKEAMTREIRGLLIQIKGNRYLEKVLVKD